MCNYMALRPKRTCVDIVEIDWYHEHGIAGKEVDS